MTATTVYEVEPVIHWRDGVRQVLAYAAQCSRQPALALYGKPSIAVKIWEALQELPSPGVEMWWHAGGAFIQIAGTAQAAALQVTAPVTQRREPQRRIVNYPPDGEQPEGLVALKEIADAHHQTMSTVRRWTFSPEWPKPAATRGSAFLYLKTEVADVVRLYTEREMPLATGPLDELLDIIRAAAEAGISASTLRADMNRGRWPAPDDEAHGVKRWKRQTVLETMAARRPNRRRWKARETAQSA